MEEFDDPNLLSFRIGTATESPRIRNLPIFIGGECVCDYPDAFMGGVPGGLIPGLKFLKAQTVFFQHVTLLAELGDLTAIHNAFVHGSSAIDADDLWLVKDFHSFLNWEVPETDIFRAFLYPYEDRLWLTHQTWVDHTISFPKLDVVHGIAINLPDTIAVPSDTLQGIAPPA